MSISMISRAGPVVVRARTHAGKIPVKYAGWRSQYVRTYVKGTSTKKTLRTLIAVSLNNRAYVCVYGAGEKEDSHAIPAPTQTVPVQLRTQRRNVSRGYLLQSYWTDFIVTVDGF